MKQLNHFQILITEILLKRTHAATVAKNFHVIRDIFYEPMIIDEMNDSEVKSSSPLLDYRSNGRITSNYFVCI